MIWIPLKERSGTLWSYAFSEKYSKVWERQLQNILITAVIDTEARLCELMNPKGAPLMWAGLWHSDSCKAKSEADSVSEIADWHWSAVIHHLWYQAADRWTDNLPKRFLMRSKKRRVPSLHDGIGFRVYIVHGASVVKYISGFKTAFA